MNAKPNDTTPEDVAADWGWASRHEPALLSAFRDLLFSMAVKDSTSDEDMKQATDYKVSTIGSCRVACRVRRISNVGRKRDFTLRCARKSGATTEVDKLQEYCPDVYLYGWATDDGKLEEYMIIDMTAFLDSGLLHAPTGVTWCRDGSAAFAYWDRWDLQDAGCIIEGVTNPGGAVSFKINTEWHRQQK